MVLAFAAGRRYPSLGVIARHGRATPLSKRRRPSLRRRRPTPIPARQHEPEGSRLLDSMGLAGLLATCLRASVPSGASQKEHLGNLHVPWLGRVQRVIGGSDVQAKAPGLRGLW